MVLDSRLDDVVIWPGDSPALMSVVIAYVLRWFPLIAYLDEHLNLAVSGETCRTKH